MNNTYNRNCAISIEHNLKMGVRPIFVTVRLLSYVFSPMLRHSSLLRFGCFFLFSSVPQLCSVSSPPPKFVCWSSKYFQCVYAWCFQFIFFPIFMAVFRESFGYTPSVCRFLCHNSCTQCARSAKNIYVSSRIYWLCVYFIWFLWRIPCTNLFCYIVDKGQHVTTERNSKWNG